jgi:hypothetical protein
MGYWRFSPAMRAGLTVPARLRYRVSFQPDEIPADLMNMARRLHAGNHEDFVPPRLVQDAPKVLRTMEPFLLKESGGTGPRHRVTLGIVVTAAGDVLLPRIEDAPDPLVGYAAATAIPYWKFSPAYRDKQPVQVNVTLPVHF